MHSWEAIELSLNYIEEHLTETLATEYLADMVGLSPFYYQRLYKRLVKKPVQEYIKFRRLAKSVELLKTSELRILDIALESGYSSHANYTRAFKETFNMTPEEYRMNRPTLNTFIKPEISMHYTVVDENVPLIAGNIILEVHRRHLEKPEKYLGYDVNVSISCQTPVGEKNGIDVPGEAWNKFHAFKNKTNGLFMNGIELGVSHSPDPATDIFKYFAGGLIDETVAGHVANSDMSFYSLQAGEYVVCTIEADSFEFLVTNALYQGIEYLHETWLPKNNISSFGPFEAEKYFKDNADVPRMEYWIPVKQNG